MNNKSTYEGLQEKVKELEFPEIETFKNQYPNREYVISIQSGNGELSSICPKTGLPDFATLNIVYTPLFKCIELKSLKEYIGAYRDIGIFHEFLANRILEDLVKAVEPRNMNVSIEMNPRGNITTTVEADYEEGDSSISLTENLNF